MLVSALAAAAFLVAGVVAWRSRSGRRLGPLLVAEGVLWTLYQLPLPVPREVLAVTVGAWPALLAHLVMAFPTGTLGSRMPRVVVAQGYVCVVVMGVRHVAGREAAEVIGDVGTPALVLVGAAVIAMQVLRLRNSSVARRRMLTPVLVAAVVATALFVVWKPLMVTGGSAPVLALSARAAFAAVPLAILWSLLRRRMDRGGVAGLVVRLNSEPHPATLQTALAETLHDPTLRVGYWVQESKGYLDVEEARCAQGLIRW
ncbi:hypothetical protein ACFQYP_17835 [Nonomuraea antimicrobica]